MRMILLLSAALLLAACAPATRGPVPREAEPAAQEKAPPAKIRAAGIEDIREAISSNLTSAEKARIAFSSRGDDISRKIAGRLVTMFRGAFSLESAGLGGLPPERVLAQLDARTTPSMVYVDYRKDGALAVTLYATESGFSRELFFDYRYGDDAPRAGAAPQKLAGIAMKPEAAICDGSGNVYLRDGARIAVFQPDLSREILSVTYPCEQPSFFCADGEVSLFCAGTSTGKTFSRAGQNLEAKGIDSFPLPARAERFIYVGKDELGNTALLDKSDAVLGSFTELCLFKISGTSIFAGITPEGDLWGMRGDMIAPLRSVLKGPYARLASGEQSIFALRASGEVERITLDDKFEWKVDALKTGITEKPSAIACTGARLLLFCPGDKGSAVYSVAATEAATGGE